MISKGKVFILDIYQVKFFFYKTFVNLVNLRKSYSQSDEIIFYILGCFY